MLQFTEFTTNNEERWLKEVELGLKGGSIEKLYRSDAIEEISIKPLYTRDDINSLDTINSLPANAPFLRGFHIPQMFPRTWNIVQKTTIEESIQIAQAPKSFLEAGFNTIELYLHSNDLTSIETLLIFLPQNLKLYLKFSPDTVIPMLQRMKQIHHQESLLNVSLAIDPISHHKQDTSCESEILQMLEHLREFNQERNIAILRIDGCMYHHAGVNIVQELAIVMALAVEYLRLWDQLNIPPKISSKWIHFAFGVSSQFLYEISKLRAARLLWHFILDQAEVQSNDQTMFIHCETSLTNITLYDPETNLLRTTTETLAAVLGNVDSIWVAPYDFYQESKKDFTEQYAKNIPLILREEAHIADLMDPIGGSYAIESLTQQIAEKAYEKFQQIENNGGIIPSIQSGTIQNWVKEVTLKKKNHFIQRKRKLIGINESPNPNEIEPRSNQYQNNPTVSFLTPFIESEPIETIRSKVLQSRSLRKDCKVTILTLGNITSFIPRYDFTKAFFEIGGFEVETVSIKDVSEWSNTDPFNNNVVAICSTEQNYSMYLNTIVPLLRTKNPSTLIFLMGEPKLVSEKEHYQSLGINSFIHNHSNIIEIFQYIIQAKGIEL
ncbi:MAG: methylmalonyl-CoA mutase family protein [bacterium]|nr:methylmalonyl-CoA mutase family protein [bacterium]